MTKSADPDPLSAGDILTYTIEARNIGSASANVVRVLDTPPANFTYTAFATNRGSCVVIGSLTGGTLDCDVGPFGSGGGASATITVAGFVSSAVDTIVTNSAEIDPDDVVPESVETNNFDSVSTTVLVPTPTSTPSDTPTATATPTVTPTDTPPPQPDLIVIKSDAPDPVASGDTLTYTLEVRNIGDAGAASVQLLDQPPANFTYTAFGTTRGACALHDSVMGGALDCDLGAFSTGPTAAATITVTGFIISAVDTAVTNTATVDPIDKVSESNEANNTAQATTQVIGAPPPATPTATPVTPTPTATPTTTGTPPTPTTTPSLPDLIVTKIASPDPATATLPLAYTIEVRNAGGLEAATARLVDTPPADFTYTSFGTTAGACAIVDSLTGGRLECELGTMAPGASATVTVTGWLANPGTATNTATIDPFSEVAEADETNNQAEAVVSVADAPTPTPTLTPTATPTGLPTATPTPTNTPTVTPTPTNTPTPTPGPAFTVIVLPGQTLTPGAGVTGTPNTQTAGVPFAVDVFALMDDLTVATTAVDTVTLTTGDPNDAEPAPQPLAAGQASFTINPRTADGTGWQIQPSGGPGSNVASGLYVVGPSTVDRTIVVLPGQTLNSGAGLQGTPDAQLVGTAFAADVAAIDQFFNIVPSAAGTVSLGISCASYCQDTDPGSVGPASQPLTNGQAAFTITPTTLGGWQATPSGGPAANAPSDPYTVAVPIDTSAGNGAPGLDGDGGPAAAASFTLPVDVARDDAGNLYVADSGNNRIRRISPSGTVTTFAGGGSGCAGQTNTLGDGCPATQASLSSVTGVAVDGTGNVYISDQLYQRIRMVDTSGIITTIAGTGTPGFGGDGGPATEANIQNPFGLALDGAGNLYIADASNNRIRRVTPAGVISTIAGDGVPSYDGDGIPAVFARLSFPTDVAFDAAGNMYISDSGNSVVRVVDTGGIIGTFAGRGTLSVGGDAGFSGDGGPATNAQLSTPFGVTVDIDGQIFIADSGNQRIRMVNQAGVITTVAGAGQFGFGGDGGPATAALMDVPMGLALDGTNLLLADMNNHRIRFLIGVASPPPPPPTPTPTPTSTPAPTATPTATPTPDCPDADGDTLNDCAELTFGTDPNNPDTDADGCLDGQEVGQDETIGGRRDPTNFWDFFDTPDEQNIRDRAISVADLLQIVTRFGSFGSTGLDPLTLPPAPPTYHTAFDRASPPTEAEEPDPSKREPWDLQAADGVVSIQDIGVAVRQFGHSCIQMP